MQAARDMVVEQVPGIVAAVEDDDIAGAQRTEMARHHGAFVLVRDQHAIHRHPLMQTVEAAQHALRVMGVVRRQVLNTWVHQNMLPNTGSHIRWQSSSSAVTPFCIGRQTRKAAGESTR